MTYIVVYTLLDSCHVRQESSCLMRNYHISIAITWVCIYMPLLHALYTMDLKTRCIYNMSSIANMAMFVKTSRPMVYYYQAEWSWMPGPCKWCSVNDEVEWNVDPASPVSLWNHWCNKCSHVLSPRISLWTQTKKKKLWRGQERRGKGRGERGEGRGAGSEAILDSITYDKNRIHRIVVKVCDGMLV